MGRLRVLASGASRQTQAQARGKLFEKLMSEVLRHYGYSIDQIPNVNYAGMEIDIYGKHKITGAPLYAECKCYETEIDSPKFQGFFGKYMGLWLDNRRYSGIFIALPGINSHAKGFYREKCEERQEISVQLMEEEQVVGVIFDVWNIIKPDFISRFITSKVGTAGDWLLLYTDKGLFFVQYIIPPGGAISNSVALFDARGIPLSDKPTIDYLIQLYPELNDFDQITVGSIPTLQLHDEVQDLEEIVEVRGSSACFEYQFPASPEYFVGRKDILEEFDSFVMSVINKETSSRGLLFEANSGWGKSSVVLACVDYLKKINHFAVAIDCRSASSSKFILRVVNYALNKFGDFDGILSEDEGLRAITGFDGAVKAILHVGQLLENKNKILFIFLDQFENIFFLQDTLRRIRDMFLKICDVQTNIVLGFSWKTDLIGLTSEFPYQLRDAITGSSRCIPLKTFSIIETTALLNRLSKELRAPLRKDLEFFLSEFSQGYPWLLKKLCAHVKAQREEGVLQSGIASSLLNVEELFKEDLCGLSAAEDEVLKRIAKVAPIIISELGEEFSPEVVQSLVHRRLVVRIGNKYDIYWDIFRDYLNSGRVPIQENYILRTQAGSILKSIKLLSEANSILSISEFQQRANLTEKSFLNVARDMKLLGLAKVDDANVNLQVSLPREEKSLDDALRAHLKERLRRNRLIWRLTKVLDVSNSLKLDEVAHILADSCPYISATEQTWQIYARTFANWMDAANLAIFRDGILNKPGSEVRERHILLAKRRGGVTIPCIQYKPVERAMIRIVQAIQSNTTVDWANFKKSTIPKALVMLEDLDFISRKTQSIMVLTKGLEFVNSPEKRSSLFAEGALKMDAFVTFIEILKTHENRWLTSLQLAEELKKRLDADWNDSTAKTVAKIMLNWARYTKLAPGIFTKLIKGPRKVWKDKADRQMSLFPLPNIDN